MKQHISVQQLVNRFGLEVVSGEGGLQRPIQSGDIHRPGLELTGYIGYFPTDRIQILGRTEVTYLHSLTFEQRDRQIGDLVALGPPCFIITRSQSGLEYFIGHCNEHQVPLLRTSSKSTYFISLLNNYLERELAEEDTIHGVCMNIFGVGVILRGPSGIGKSELALALVERGHRLVSDDLVIVKRVGPGTLIGTHNGNNRELLQLRGIGFIDVTRLNGSGAFQEETSLDIEIDLVNWEDYAHSELLGWRDKKVNYLGVSIPQIDIPVRPGRDLAALVQVTCKNWRLLREGYDALEEFQRRIQVSMQ